MSSVMITAIMCFLFVWLPAPAQEQQMDMEAMMRWSTAKIVSDHIVGVYRRRPRTGNH